MHEFGRGIGKFCKIRNLGGGGVGWEKLEIEWQIYEK